jgi:Hemerythrin HHE cation binding domain
VIDPNPTTDKPDTSQIAVIHRGMRGEFPRFAGYVRSTEDGDKQRAATMADHIDLFLYFVHHHHSDEDAMLWPILTERLPADRPLIETMKRQHETVDSCIKQIEPALRTWRAAPRQEAATCSHACSISSAPP